MCVPCDQPQTWRWRGRASAALPREPSRLATCRRDVVLSSSEGVSIAEVNSMCRVGNEGVAREASTPSPEGLAPRAETFWT